MTVYRVYNEMSLPTDQNKTSMDISFEPLVFKNLLKGENFFLMFWPCFKQCKSSAASCPLWLSFHNVQYWYISALLLQYKDCRIRWGLNMISGEGLMSAYWPVIDLVGKWPSWCIYKRIITQHSAQVIQPYASPEDLLVESRPAYCGSDNFNVISLWN